MKLDARQHDIIKNRKTLGVLIHPTVSALSTKFLIVEAMYHPSSSFMKIGLW
jgi:hypothetical protein